MELNERQRQILDILKRQKKVSVKSLSETLYASQMTIRRDLTNLSSSGLLTRYHGGAVAKEDDKQQPINVRHFIDDGEKKLLAQQAVRYLSDDMLVFIDCSSTCSYIIPYLKNFSKIRVVTNSVHVLLLLADAHIPCSVAGGYYYEPEM